MSSIETEAKRRRTFAIISHPDAGKTTLTEHLLLLGGAIRAAGQVKAPGGYPANSEMTLRMAIARGGGLTDLGTDHAVKVTRGGKKLDHVDLDAKFQAGDVIVVGERLF